MDFWLETHNRGRQLAEVRARSAMRQIAGRDRTFWLQPVARRSPAWGEARSFLEFDFAGGIVSGSRELSAANSLIPRLHYT
jgi:hypothetical protein